MHGQMSARGLTPIRLASDLVTVAPGPIGAQMSDQLARLLLGATRGELRAALRSLDSISLDNVRHVVNDEWLSDHRIMPEWRRKVAR